MRRLLPALPLTLLTACSQPAEPAKSGGAAPAAPAAAVSAAPVSATPPPVNLDVPAGTYVLDKAHASLNFRVSHMGFSNYTARFTRFDATLQLDPKNPAASSVTATIDPASLQTNYPEPDKLDFDKQISGAEFLDAPKFPQMTFRSIKVTQTGPNTATILGDLTFHGVTKPVMLEATYNGGYAKMAMDPSGSRIGFSARGKLNRSDWGAGGGVPAAGSNMGVSDAVEVIIEAEFTRPADK